MRRYAFVALLLAACGGAPKAATTPPGGGTATTEPSDEDAPPPPPETSVCTNRPDPLGPVRLTDAQAKARHGAQAVHYADAASSKQTPIEVCGIPASQQWLIGTTCADGSRAITDTVAATRSRAGNVGPGGRCNSIIDRYVVKCPEATHELYLDMYMCGPGETF